jgi:SulP family sulfate permease
MQSPLKSRSNRLSPIALLQQEFHPSRLIPSLTAGLISGVLLVIYAISFAALIFSGNLSQYVSIGIGGALFTSVAVSITVALMSSLPGVVIVPQDGPAVILAIVANTIATQMSASTSGNEVLSTVIVAIALTSILTGVFCFILGTFKLGDLTRFIPYPVVGGFLAGTGWLLSGSAVSLMSDLPFSFTQLPLLFQSDILIRWLPGFCFAVLILLILRRFNHVLVLPGLVLGAIALFYLLLFVTDTSIDEARDYKLLLSAFPQGGLWQPLMPSTLLQVNWGLIGAQIGNLVAILLVTAIALLLNCTGIELSTRQDIDLNRELRAAGIGNMIAGLGGGIVGFHALGMSALSVAKIGAKSRMVGLIGATVCAIALFAGASLIALFPKPVLGGVALFLGLSFLVEWVYEGWFRLSKIDYFLVILILGIIAAFGFLAGVGVGFMVALVLFVVNYSQVRPAKHILSGATYPSQAARSVQQSRLLRAEGDQIYVLELQGFLFFGTANKLLNQIRQRLSHPDLPPLKFVVFSFCSVTGLDSSAILSFTKLQQIAQQQLTLVFANLPLRIQQQLQQGGVLQAEACQVFPDLDRGIEWCENQILEAIPQRRRRSLPLALQLDNLFTNGDHVSGFMDYLEELDMEVGQVLFQQGDRADALYLIELGEVTLLSSVADQTRRIQSLGAGNLVGEIDFYLRVPHQTSAIVDQPSTLYRLSQDSAQEMRQDHPEVAATFQEFVIGTLSDRLTVSYRQVSDLLQ